MSQTNQARARSIELVALARAGGVDAAMSQVMELAREHPADTVVQHNAGVVLQLGGTLAEAITLFSAALRADPGFFYSYLEIANCHYSLDNREEALSWYLRATHALPQTGTIPGQILAYRRAAEISTEQGRYGQALGLFTQCHEADPTNPDIACSLANSLIYHNRRNDAVAVFFPVFDAGRMTEECWKIWLNLLNEVSRYEDVLRLASDLPQSIGFSARYLADMLSGNAALAVQMRRPIILEYARAREVSADWLDSAGVAYTLREAISARQPFSFIRMGDGEARFLAYCDQEVNRRLQPRLVESLGDVCFQNWFAIPIKSVDPELVLQLNASTLAAMREADILGVSTADRLQRDNAHFGYLAVLERILNSIDDRRIGQKFADSLVNIDLHRASRFYRQILSGLDFLGVICPHPGLAARLAQLHAIPESAEIVVPGESRLPDGAPRMQLVGHFPELYMDICANLTVPRPGSVFLVAAGLLGKIYCNIIRQRGGIAIDVGSIVDAWVGVNTRPGQYDVLADWMLPA
jgi:tetratricopeptide (TPR) repeat protein